MITTDNIRTIDVPQQVGNILSEAAGHLTGIQANVADRVYFRGTGLLKSKLESKPYTVDVTPSSVKLSIDYPQHIRFLDLRRSSLGKKKKVYAPIYNKYVWGFLMGYTYNSLRAGLSGIISRELTTTTLTVNT